LARTAARSWRRGWDDDDRADRAYLAIAVARGLATPEQLRRAGAHTVVAERHELL
jgi:hypothetical protein